MVEPAEDDVERLAEWAHLPGVTNVSEDRQVALNLLRRGVTLPPEPDTPAEPQERYWVDQLEDWEVRGTGGERIHCYLSNGITLAPYAPLAEQVASLFNLDARYEDGIEAELERLQDKASARAVKAAELALEDARAELIREREDRGLERDLFAARVKELETERPDQYVTAEMVYGAIEAAGVRDGLDRGDGPAYIRPCDWTSGEALAVADALNRLLGGAPPRAENERGGSDG